MKEDILNQAFVIIKQNDQKEKFMNSQPSLYHYKVLQALYVEDDAVIRESVGTSLGYFFDMVFTA